MTNQLNETLIHTRKGVVHKMGLLLIGKAYKMFVSLQRKREKRANMKRKKVLKVTLFVVALVLLWSHLPYYYSNDKAVDYISNHAGVKSKCSCAGYVMLGLWHGGCPAGLVPAYAYEKTLPQMGFQEVPTEGYQPQKGDISVLPPAGNSPFGHIAVYNGRQWVSDFSQKSLFPSSAYRMNGSYRIFRMEDGWHWKHVWTSPIDWYSWIQSLVKGYKKIKF